MKIILVVSGIYLLLVFLVVFLLRCAKKSDKIYKEFNQKYGDSIQREAEYWRNRDKI
jgi:hypothetical protein